MKSKHSSAAIARLLRSERSLWSFGLACEILALKLKSRFASFVLHAPGLFLGPGCVLRGTSFITFGYGMYAHGHLWLEAIVTYHEQCFEPLITIGDSVSFSEGVHVSCIEKISIGNGVLFGSHVYVSDHNHGSYKGVAQSHPNEPPAERALCGGGPVVIGDNTWVGDNVVIVGPVTIGHGAIIAANAVVRTDVPALSIVGGIPAKVFRQFDNQEGKWSRVPSERSPQRTID